MESVRVSSLAPTCIHGYVATSLPTIYVTHTQFFFSACGGGGPFDGFLSDVRIYAGALSASDVADLAANKVVDTCQVIIPASRSARSLAGASPQQQSRKRKTTTGE